ncbi:Diphthine--ammonia ligase [Dirofilaria immitis]
MVSDSDSRKHDESEKQDVAAIFRKSMKNIEHNKVVDAYNPYYQYFDERYKVQIGKGRKKKKRRRPILASKKVSSFKNFLLIFDS